MEQQVFFLSFALEHSSFLLGNPVKPIFQFFFETKECTPRFKDLPFLVGLESRGLGWDYPRSSRGPIRNQTVDEDFVGIGIVVPIPTGILSGSGWLF